APPPPPPPPVSPVAPLSPAAPYRLRTLTAYRRCVIPTGLARRLGALSKQTGEARIPYDNLPVLDHALLRIIRIVGWAGRLAVTLRHTITLGTACRLG